MSLNGSAVKNVTSLLLRIFATFLVIAVGLWAGLALIIIYFVFARGTSILRDPGFVGTAVFWAYCIPVASALLVIPIATQIRNASKDSRSDQ